MQDEYISELVNTEYVKRERKRHSALCSGNVWETFVESLGVLKITKRKKKRYTKNKLSCELCNWKVFEVIERKV